MRWICKKKTFNGISIFFLLFWMLGLISAEMHSFCSSYFFMVQQARYYTYKPTCLRWVQNTGTLHYASENKSSVKDRKSFWKSWFWAISVPIYAYSAQQKLVFGQPTYHHNKVKSWSFIVLFLPGIVQVLFTNFYEIQNTNTKMKFSDLLSWW